MQKRKALYFTFWVHSFLIWVYLCTRIIVNDAWWEDLFIDYIPIITFEKLGIVSFLFSFVFLYMFLQENKNAKKS